MGWGRGVSFIVVRCIKLAKNINQQRRTGWLNGLGLGLGLVIQWLWVRIPFGLWNFFLFRSPKISKFFGGLDAGTKSTKFPVLLPALYRVNLFIKLISNINFVFLSEAYPTDLSFL